MPRPSKGDNTSSASGNATRESSPSRASDRQERKMLTDADLQATLTAHHPHDMITDIGTHLGGAPVRLGECEQVGELMIKTPVSVRRPESRWRRHRRRQRGPVRGRSRPFRPGGGPRLPTLRRDLHGCGVDGVEITDETIRDPPGGQRCMQPLSAAITTSGRVSMSTSCCGDAAATINARRSGVMGRTLERSRADPIEGTVRTGRSRSGRERCRRVGPRSAGAAQSTNRCCRASRSRRLPTPAARCSHRCRADVRRGSCNHHRG